MVNESIFTFVLEEKQIFEDVYKKALILEKQIVDKMFDSVFNTSRVIIEKLVKIIIVEVEEDKRLSEQYYKKKKGHHISLSTILYKCRDKKYITSFNKLKSFIDTYGNAGSHDNDETFCEEDMKNAHKVVFDFTEECAKKYNKRIKVPTYTFDLSYIEEKTFTKDEKDEMVEDAKISEVSTEDIVKKAEDTYISREKFEEIIKPLITNIEEVNAKLDETDYITNDNLDSILNNYDESIKDKIIKEVKETNIKNTQLIKEELAEIKQKQTDMYMSKEEFIDIVMPIAQKVQDIDVDTIVHDDYITDDNLSFILTHFDESIRTDILNEVLNYKNEIKIELAEIKDNQITLAQINELIEENNNEILTSIKSMANEIIKDQLSSIILEIQSVPTVEGGVVIDNPEYEIIESENVVEIKEIEEIIGIPDKCPKCGAILKKGAIKCYKCGLDLLPIIDPRCPECGKRVSIGSDICDKCGSSLKTKKCSGCGFENKYESKFCINCGKKFGD